MPPIDSDEPSRAAGSFEEKEKARVLAALRQATAHHHAEVQALLRPLTASERACFEAARHCYFESGRWNDSAHHQAATHARLPQPLPASGVPQATSEGSLNGGPAPEIKRADTPGGQAPAASLPTGSSNTLPHGLPLQAALINAQEALEKIQNLFSMASRISDQIAWQVDLSNFQLIWSEDLRALYHLPPGDPPGVEETIGFFAPEHQAPIRALFENCIATGAPFDKEVQIVTSTGQRIWMRVLGEASRAPSGEIRWIQGVTQNIEQQKQAEARERTLAHRLATTLESVSDAFFLVNDRWEFVFLNRQTENITKRGSADFLGKNLWEVFPEAVGSEIETHYRRAVEQRVTVRFETFFAPLESWLEISAHPTDDGLAVYFRDITQKRVDAEQLQLLQTAVSKLNDIVIITDANSVSEDGACIVFVNDAFVKRTGYARAEVLGKSSRIFTGPSSNAAELDRIRSALQQQQSVRAEMIHYTKSGEEMWVELMVAPMVSEAGSVTHFVTVERDISERKQAEAQILTLNADLERRVQARTAELERTTADLQMLSYSLAHDLRQPLIAMSGYSHLLQKQVQGVQAARYLERISAGIHEINTRADALLYFANLSRLPLQRKDIDLGGIARRRIDKLLAGEPDRQVSAIIQPGLMASADPDLMEQVMQELLDNAWRSSASQQLALLEVGSSTGTDGQTAYFVRDNGEGFDMAYVNSLFEPFQKLDLTEAHAGHGLGLARVKRIVSKHGGRIWAQGKAASGATIFFTLSS